MKYDVDFYEFSSGMASPIDTIEAPEGYTAEDYIRDCEENADAEWVEMIHRGIITIVPLGE
jgi:hypothetical protein